jgi:hypothetical protein
VGGTYGIAKWNGSSWSSLGYGLEAGAYVFALAASGSDLYVGGAFRVAGAPATNVAKWNGSNWSALGAGITNTTINNTLVWALAASGSDLYAGATFAKAGIATGGVVKWNGSVWSDLGAGFGGGGQYGSYVYALAVSGSNLYVGGDFTRATNSGGISVTANQLAKWDGNSWSGLGSGMNNYVTALAVSGSDLYAGGAFTTAGGKVSAYAAKAIAIPGDWLRLARDVPGLNTNTLSFVGVPEQPYTIQYATNLEPALWQPLATTNTDAGGRGIVQDPDASSAPRFYRVTSP